MYYVMLAFPGYLRITFLINLLMALDMLTFTFNFESAFAQYLT